MCISGLRAKFTAYHYYHLTPCHTKLGQGYCDDSGVRTHSYDCPPHIKYVKRFIYVWSRSGMSIKWMRGPYHYITVWYMSKIYTSTSKLAKAIVMTGSKDTLIWLPTTYKVCQTPFICMKWIWYEYAGDGRSQSYPTACPQWEPHSESYDPAHPFWSDGMVWWCGNITASHGWRLLNTFYRYEVDLVWVWSGWEVLIISYSMSPVRTPLRILRLAHSLLEWWYSMVLWQYGCQPWLKAFKHFL